MTTIEAITDALAELDPELDRDSDAFRVGLILLSGISVGADEETIITFSGLDETFVREVGGRLRASGIWVDGMTDCEWFEDEDGGTAFWMDVLVGQGLLERVEG